MERRAPYGARSLGALAWRSPVTLSAWGVEVQMWNTTFRSYTASQKFLNSLPESFEVQLSGLKHEGVDSPARKTPQR